MSQSLATASCTYPLSIYLVPSHFDWSASVMSFKKGLLHPCAPVTARGESTKLSSSKDKIVYTNGRSVIVSSTKLHVYMYRLRTSTSTL